MTNNQSFIYEQLQVLCDKVDLLFQSDCEEPLRKKQQKAKSSVAQQIDVIEKLLKEELLPLADPPIKACGTKRRRGVAQAKEPYGQSNVKFKSSMNEDETKESRNLLVSNGCVIYLLDLKQSKNEPLCNADYISPLPKLATLKLIENKLPMLVGLFNLGSAAHMIGGHEFPTNWKPSSLHYTDDYIGYSFYKALHREKSLKGTSCATYRLSLADDGTLTQSKGKIKKLKSPKLWPIVEEISVQIHVLDSAPSGLWKPDGDWIFSHEVIKCDGRRWSEIPTTGVQGAVKWFITSHTVLGNLIFTVDGKDFMVLYVGKKEWEVRDSGGRGDILSGAAFIKQVWEVLNNGIASCVGEFPLISSDDPLYVLVAVVQVPYWRDEMVYYNSDEEEDVSTHMMACSNSL